MKIVFLTATFLAVVATTAGQSTNSPAPCNPAVHCNPQAVECTECNPSVDADCDWDAAANQNPGLCTDYNRPTILANGDPDYTNLINMSVGQISKRCIQIMDVTGVKKLSQRYNYISAAPEGYLTCFDGFIASKRRECVKRCNNNKKCKKKNGQFQVNPVRFAAARCTEDCRQRRTVMDECSVNDDDVTDLISQIPEAIPVPPADTVCCTGSNIPWEGQIELNEYEAGTCCPYLPEGEIIGPSSGESTDPTYRIFNVPIDTYVNDNNGYSLSSVCVADLSFNEAKSDECCCSLHCSCYGDPHCVAFNHVQRTSLEEGLEFTMFSEGPTGQGNSIDGFFLVNITNGERGVADKLTMKFADDDTFIFKLASEQAHANCWERTNLNNGVSSYPPQENLPVQLTENFKGISTADCPAPPVDPSETFRAQNRIYSSGVEVSYKVQTHSTNDYARFDIELTRYVTKKEECCPAPNVLLEDLLDNQPNVEHGGFCYLPNGEEANAAFVAQGRRRRMLATSEDPDSFCYNVYCAAKGGDSSCVQECLNLVEDFGIAAMTEEMAETANTCYNADNPIFEAPLSDCEGGLSLQATRKGQENWQFVRAYPSEGYQYCDDKLTIPFEEGSELTFTYNGNANTLLDYEVFDIRFVERIDVAQSCNPCQTKASVENLQFLLNVFLEPSPAEEITCTNGLTCRTCTDSVRRYLLGGAIGGL